MKKNMMLLPVVVLFVAILNCRSADAGIFSGLKDVIHNTSANVKYHTDVAACFAEVGDLQEQIDAAFNRFYQEANGNYDLRRQMNDCWRDREDIIISLDECREMNGEASDGEGYGSASAGGLENHGGPYPVIDRNLLARSADFMVNGTCEEPKTDRRREECLSGCHAIAEWLRDDLARATYRANHVEESMREDIAYCQLELGSLQNELTICNNGGNVGDTVDPLSSPEGDVMVCTVDADGNEVCTTEGDDTCTLDPEGNAFCSADPSDGPPADSSDNEATGGDQEPGFMERVAKLIYQVRG